VVLLVVVVVVVVVIVVVVVVIVVVVIVVVVVVVVVAVNLWFRLSPAADSSSAIQEIPHILFLPKIFHRVHDCPQLFPIQGHINTIYICTNNLIRVSKFLLFNTF